MTAPKNQEEREFMIRRRDELRAKADRIDAELNEGQQPVAQEPVKTAQPTDHKRGQPDHLTTTSLGGAHTQKR